MSIARIGRSPCGAAFRSPCGALTDGSIFKRSLSDSLSLSENSVGVRYILPIFSNRSSRFDNPFGTQSGNITTNNTLLVVGNVLQGFPVGNFRDRHGYTFAIDSSYPGATGFFLETNLQSFGNSPVPEIYISNADDHSLYTVQTNKTAWNWEAHLNTLLFTGLATGTNLNTINLTPYLGTNISLILGEHSELNNTGVNDRKFQISANPALRIKITY